MSKSINVRKLPIVPDDWLARDNVFVLQEALCYVDASKTRTEVWEIVLLKADAHYVAYRRLRDTHYGYGG